MLYLFICWTALKIFISLDEMQGIGFKKDKGLFFIWLFLK